MPIQVEDYTWTQNANLVNIEVPLKGVPGNKVDIFNTDEYIKASYPPYIFEVFLNASVNDSKSKATIRNGIISFDLVKNAKDVIWPQLQHDSYKDKSFKQEKRDQAVSYSQQKAREDEEFKAKQKDQQKKLNVRQQMRLEEEERQKLQKIKDAEQTQMIEDIESWKKKQSEPEKSIEGSKCSSKSTNKEDDNPTSGEHVPKEPARKNGKRGDSIFGDDNVPPPRTAATIQLNFTPRAFVTPSRESKAPEEEEWLRKVEEMKKAKVSKTSEENFEDMNPVWLKDKGNDFYKKGNFVAAINAFTAAIMLNGTDPSSYNNRAACHLHMKQFAECIQDTTMALNLLDPPVQANAKSRCIALVRRGTAHFQVNDYVEALRDYDAALKIDPGNENLKADAEKIREIIQGTSIKN